jgi:hypothetical protein
MEEEEKKETKNYEIEDFKIGWCTIDNGFSKNLLKNFKPDLTCLEYIKKNSKDLKIEKLEKNN